MHPVKCVCENTPKKNGLHAVYIQYCYSPEKRTWLYTGVAIPLEKWDQKRSRIYDSLPVQFGDASLLNKRLRGMITVVNDLIDLAQYKALNPQEFIKSAFRPGLEESGYSRKTLCDDFAIKEKAKDLKSLSFFEQLDEYMASRERKVSPVMFARLQEHEGSPAGI